LPHRYRVANGFDNPSVYCADLMKLITHIRGAVGRELPPSMHDKLRLAPLSYAEARSRLPPRRVSLRPSLPVIA
jgi:uncharacterized protein